MSMTHKEPRGLSLNDALEVLASKAVPILAGGTDFFPALGEKAMPDQLLDITSVSELRGVTRDRQGWHIGATTTWTDIINAELPAAFDGLKAAAKEVGSIQIQNAATIAGNICNASPAADGVPPLLALNASVELASLTQRRRLPLAEFINGPRSTALAENELLVSIHVPTLSDDVRSGFYKLGSRKYLVISIAMASVTLAADESGQLTDVKIVVGACSAVARRLELLEKNFIGQSVHCDVMSLITSSAFDELTPIDDVRASGHYRKLAAHQIVMRLILSTMRQLPQYQQPQLLADSEGQHP
jgi:CO/xanthine dehydrogenase FAD-binding subunit